MSEKSDLRLSLQKEAAKKKDELSDYNARTNAKKSVYAVKIFCAANENRSSTKVIEKTRETHRKVKKRCAASLDEKIANIKYFS